MKNFMEKVFTRYSPSTYIRETLSGERQDSKHVNKDKEVYLNSRGELILNLEHPEVRKKLTNQIETFAKVELNNQR